MYLRICVKTKFCERILGDAACFTIGEFYLSDHGRQPQFGQNSILGSSKPKKRNWKIINCFLYMCARPFSLTKNKGNFFLVPKSSQPLLAGLPLETAIQLTDEIRISTHNVEFSATFSNFFVLQNYE